MYSVKTQLSESHVVVDCEEDAEGVSTITECLKHYADILGDAEAMVFTSSSQEEPRRAISWNDVYYKSAAAARAFIQLGIRSFIFSTSFIMCLVVCVNFSFVVFALSLLLNILATQVKCMLLSR